MSDRIIDTETGETMRVAPDGPGWELGDDGEFHPRRQRMSDPLKPSVTLLCKLGSIVVHADEGLGSKGHQFDLAAISALVSDREVIEWLDAMDSMALLPVRRS